MIHYNSNRSIKIMKITLKKRHSLSCHIFGKNLSEFSVITILYDFYCAILQLV